MSWVEAMGWTLLHFVWQGVVVAALLALVMPWFAGRGAEVRYAVSCCALLVLALFPVSTLALLLAGGATGYPVRLGPSIDVSAFAVHPMAPFLPWITTLWFTCVCVLQLRALLFWSYAVRLRSLGTSPLPERCRQMVRGLRERMRVTRSVRVLRSTAARVPMVIGWLRPVILVPAEALTGLDEEQLRAVLAHELAHIRRHDYPINLLQVLLESLLFYHPAVWWISGRVREEREFCCDDLAVRTCGSAAVFARALARLDAMRLVEPRLAVAATGGSLMQRIARLAGKPESTSTRSLAFSVLATTLLLAGIAVTGFSLAGEPRAQAPGAVQPETSTRPELEEHEIVELQRELEVLMLERETLERRERELRRKLGMLNDDLVDAGARKRQLMRQLRELELYVAESSADDRVSRQKLLEHEEKLHAVEAAEAAEAAEAEEMRFMVIGQKERLSEDERREIEREAVERAIEAEEKEHERRERDAIR